MTLLAEAVRRHAGGLAIVDGALRLTWSDLARASGGIAQRLDSLGVGRNARVALVMNNSASMVAACHAIWSVGASVLPLSPNYREFELTRYLVGFDVPVAIVDDASAARIESIVAAKLPSCRVLRRSTLADADGAYAPVEVDGDAPALHLFSSGTTGQSKKIARTHRALHAEALSLSAGMKLTQSDRVVATVPLFHSYGFGMCILATAHVGAATLLFEEFRPEVLEHVRRERATVLPAVPFVYGLAAESPDRTADLSSLRIAMCAGSPLQRAVRDAFEARYEVPIRQQYGTSETGALTFNANASAATWDSVGLPLPGVLVEIWNDDGRKVPVGEIGDVVVRSPAQARSYSDTSHEVNRRSFVDGFFITGDVGRLDAEGNLFLVGRKKKFIDTATHKVDPTEVEEILRTHPAVKEVAVVGVPGPYGSDVVKAVVVAEGTVRAPELAAFCRTLLTEHKIPTVFTFTDALPKNPLGKLMRKYLVTDRAAELDDPRLGAEILELLREGLDVAEIAPADQFFAVGGSSLVAVKVSIAIEERFGVSIPLASFFSSGTIADLVDLVRQGIRNGAAKGGLEGARAREVRPVEAPLSHAQLDYWTWEEAHPRTSFWNSSEALRLRGSVDVDALAAALTRLAERHDALRTTFDVVGGVPRQYVRPPMPIELARDALAPSVAWPDARLAEERHVLFDLRRGPPMRARLYELAPDDHILQLTAHHLVVDATSIETIWKDLAALYAGVPLEPPPMQLAEFAIWQTENVGPHRFAEAIQRSKDALAGAAPLRFVGRPIGDDAVPLTVETTTSAPRATVERLAGSIEGGATVVMVAVAAYAVLLSKLCENDDLVIRVPYNDRPLSAVARSCGCFVGNFFVRVSIADDPPFTELLARVRASMLDGMQSFVPARFALGPIGAFESELGRATALANPTAPPFPSFAGVPCEKRFVPSNRIIAALFARFVEIGSDTIAAVIRTRSDMFDADETRRVGNLWRTVVDEAVAAPDRRVRTFSSL